MTSPQASGEARGRLVLVTGSGRSGTSTVAGALERLGCLVPRPHVPADDSNPRGFYEPLWVVELHKEILDRVPGRTNDARPAALDLIRDATRGAPLQARVTAWLAEQVATAGPEVPIVVKDPRTMWFTHLWRRAAEDNDVRLSHLTMLRHPVEVARSRDAHYTAGRSAEFRVKRQTANVASWVNGAVVTAAVTSEEPRAFVRYADLLADWRTALDRAAGQLGIAFPDGPRAGVPHAVDDFIDPRLNRSAVRWDEMTTWPELQELAVLCWDALDAMVEEPDEPAAAATLRTVGERYARLHAAAEAVALDHTNISVQVARRRARHEAREELAAAPPHAHAPARALAQRLARRLLAASRRR